MRKQTTHIKVILYACIFLFFSKTDKVTLEDPCFHPDYKVNKSFQSVFDSPCIKTTTRSQGLKNFTHMGQGDWNKCQEAIKKVFPKNNCNYSNCSFNGVFQPTIEGRFGVRMFRINMVYFHMWIKWMEHTKQCSQFCETLMTCICLLGLFCLLLCDELFKPDRLQLKWC